MTSQARYDVVIVGARCAGATLATFSARQVVWWTLEAAVRGSPHVIPEFIAMAKRGSADNRELRLRQRLLAEAFEAELRALPTQARRSVATCAGGERAAPRRSGG
jgi:hypothetical protein